MYHTKAKHTDIVLLKSHECPDLMQSCYQLFSEHRDNPWHFNTFRKSYENPTSLLLIVENTLCAYLLMSVTLGEAEVEAIGVKKTHRNKGFAKHLLSAGIDLLREQKITSVLLEVNTQNLHAISLYKGLGFCIWGLRNNYYQVQGGSYEDAHIMGLVLT